MKKLMMTLVLMPMMALAGTIGDGLDNTSLVWTTGGIRSVSGENVNWTYNTDDSNGDGDCVVSGAGGAGDATSWLKTTVVGPCAISFYYRFQTYGGSFTFKCDSSTLISRTEYTSQNEPWTHEEFELASGSHELTWEYHHPGMGFVGAFNGVHLDNFTATNQNPPTPSSPKTWYVNGSTGSDSNSGTSESAPKATIQAAIDASAEGDTILVAAGTYAPIVTDNKAITIKSTEGAANTIIDGGNSQPCAILGNEVGDRATVLNGFTICKGYTSSRHGAGIYCGTIKNCYIHSCTNTFRIFDSDGGGAYGALVEDCIFENNCATHGAGLFEGIAYRSVFRNNYAYDDGGAMNRSSAYDCLIVNNYANNWGGSGSGAAGCNVTNYNCTVVGNHTKSGGIFAGQTFLANCIVCDNTWDSGLFTPEDSDTSMVNCYVDTPGFVDAANGDYRLAAGSPCIDAGENSYVTTATDLTGNTRIVNGTVDIGCYEYGASPTANGLYMVIDLSGGTSAVSYSVGYLDVVPDGGWTDEHKTTKLVLRRIGSDDGAESPYYIGVFELTQRQWELVMGTRPSYYTNESYYATRPVECVSYDMIRGADAGAQYPNSTDVDETSFMGTLRRRTQLYCDLPTEAQWRIACLAGQTSDIKSGRGRYAWGVCFSDPDRHGDINYKYSTMTVGSYEPNEWGLYDMFGNVGEIVLDRSPVDASKIYHVGGSWNRYESMCQSIRTTYYDDDLDPDMAEDWGVGFRLCVMIGGTQVMPPSPGHETYTVTFDLNGADGTAPTERSVAEGTAVGELPDVSRAGYSFDGWWTTAEGGVQVTAATVVTGDVTYYAKWTAECSAESDLKIGKVYVGQMWKSATYTDNELRGDGSDIGLYGTEYAFIPVTGTGTIRPIIFYGDTPVGYLDSAQVWTDQQMFSTFTPSGISPSKWEDDGDEWEYESGNQERSFPKEVWPEKTVVADRRWVVIKAKEAAAWAGTCAFCVGLAGTSEISSCVYVHPSEYALNPSISGHLRGLTVSGVERFASWTWHDFDEHDGAFVSEYNFYNVKQVDAGKRLSFSIAVPAAGTLVIAGSEKDHSLASKEYIGVSGRNVVSDTMERRSSDVRFSDESFWKTSYAKAIRRIKVSAATTLTFTHSRANQVEVDFTRMYFFPSSGKSVAIEVGYFDRDEDVGVNLVRGRVTGSGVYKSGETATFKAVAGDGEVFDHWEVRFGNLTLTEEQAKSPTLSFKVTDAMCGGMEDEEQIFISAIWKPKYRLTVLPSIVGAGTVTGSGRYHEGETATLSAVAAKGCVFIKWSDGVTNATRTLMVTAADARRVIYACFAAPDGVPMFETYEAIVGKAVTINVGLVGYAVKGLPAGLKYDSKKGKVSGTAKKATAASGVTVTFTKKGKPAVKVIVVVRKEVLSAGCEELDGATVAAGIVGSGTIPLQLSTESGVKSVAVTGLPPGMKFDTKKRVITGFPTKGGDYTVTIKLTGKTGASKTVKLTMHVDALPTSATGTFHGFATTESGKTLGAFTLTAASSGALTAKVVGANKTYAFSKSGWDSVEEGVYVAELATKAGDRLVLRVDSTAAWDANQLTGTLTPAAGDAATVSAQRRAFGKTWRFVATGDAQSGWTLAYAEPSETANITVSLAADGVTTLAGKLGTYAVSASGYVNVGCFTDGVLIADFAPIVTVGKGKTAKKFQFVVLASLWFDSAAAPEGDVGSAYLEQ